MIAGAGSGKTTVMAARVVWLVATGQVAPGRGPRPHLHHQGDRRARRHRIRDSLREAGLLPEPRAARRRRRRGGGRGADRRDLPRLRRRAAHRARPADRPRARHPADRRRQPLPARRPRGAALHRPGRAAHRLARPRRPVPPRPRRRDERAPGHPRPGARATTPPSGRGSTPGWPPSTARPTARRTRRRSPPSTERAELLGLVEAYRGAQAPPRPDGLLRPDRARRRGSPSSARRSARSSAASSRSCCSTSTRTPRSRRR